MELFSENQVFLLLSRKCPSWVGIVRLGWELSVLGGNCQSWVGIVRLAWELSVLGGNFPFSLCQSFYIDVRTIHAKSYQNRPINKKNTILGGGGGGRT